MKRRTVWWAPLLGALLALGACGERREFLGYPVVKLGPSTAGDYVYLANGTLLKLYVIEAKTAAVTVLELPRQAIRMQPDPAGQRLLILSLLGDADHPDSPMLTIVEGQKIVRQIVLPSPYDSLAVRPDSRLAIAYFGQRATARRQLYEFDAMAGGRQAGAAINANELALIDLESGAVSRLPLEVSSLGPRGFVFAEAETAGKFLAAVLLDNAISILDTKAASPTARTYVLRESSGTTYMPVEAFFSADQQHLFLQTTSLNVVWDLTISGEGPDMELSHNLMGATDLPLEKMLPMKGENAAGQVVALYGNRLAILSSDVQADSGVEFDLSGGGATFKNAEWFTGGQADLLLLFDPGSDGSAGGSYYRGETGIAIVDPAAGEVRFEQLAFGLGTLLFSSDRGRAVMIPGDNGSVSISLMRVPAREKGERLKANWTTISLPDWPLFAALAPAANTLLAGIANSNTLVRLNLDDMSTTSIAIDDPVPSPGCALSNEDAADETNGGLQGSTASCLNAGLTAAGNYVFVYSEDQFGTVTFVPLDEFSRDKARRLTGIWLIEALNLPEEQNYERQ